MWREFGGLAGCLAAAITLAVPVLCPAAEISVAPAVSLVGEYTDNLDFEPTGRKSDLSMTLTPSVSGQAAGERYSLSASAGADFLRYRRFKDHDDVRQNYAAGATARTSERLQWNLGGRYRQYSALESQIEETGLVRRPATRRVFGGNGGMSFQLDAASDVTWSYSHSRNTFDSRQYVNYNTDQAVLTYGRKREGWLSGVQVSPWFSRYDSSQSQVNVYGVLLGATARPGETVKLSASLGPRYTVIHISPQPFRPEGDGQTEWGISGEVSAERLGETHSAAFGLSESQSYGSEGEALDTARAWTTIRKSLSERWKASLSASYALTWSPTESRRDTRYVEASPSISWQITEHGSLSAFYKYGRSYDNSRTEEKIAERNRIWVSAGFNFPERW